MQHFPTAAITDEFSTDNLDAARHRRCAASRLSSRIASVMAAVGKCCMWCRGFLGQAALERGDPCVLQVAGHRAGVMRERHSGSSISGCHFFSHSKR